MRYPLRSWEPFRVPRLFDTFMQDVLENPEWTPSTLRGAFSPAADVRETDTHYVVSVDLPGMNKNEIQVELKGDQLIISGERKEEHTSNKEGTRIEERSFGKFERIFSLPSSVDATKIEAQHKEGVLRVAIPKAEREHPKVIPIREETSSGFFNKLLSRDEESSKKVR